MKNSNQLTCPAVRNYDTSMCLYSVAAITNYYKFSSLKQHKFILLQCWRSEPQYVCTPARSGKIQVCSSSCRPYGKTQFLFYLDLAEFSSLPAVGLRSPCPCWLSAHGIPASNGQTQSLALGFLSSSSCLLSEVLCFEGLMWDVRVVWLQHLSPHWSPGLIRPIWLVRRVSPSSLTVPCASLPKLHAWSKNTTFPNRGEDWSSVGVYE